MSELEHDGVDEEVDEENDEIALDDASLRSALEAVLLVVDTPAELDADTLRAMFRALLDSHEALRSSLQIVAGVLWNMQSAPPGSVDVDDVLRIVTLDRSVFDDPDALAAAVSAESSAAAGRLSPGAGRMVGATWLTTGLPSSSHASTLRPSPRTGSSPLHTGTFGEPIANAAAMSVPPDIENNGMSPTSSRT